MAIQTKITVQQMMMKESGSYRVGKYPRYVITLGNSLSSVTVEELATAVGNANAAANAAAASQVAAKTSETNSKASETAAKASQTAAAASQTAAAASQTAAKTSETNAATSAQTALDALQGIKDAQDQSPFPDLWLPLNDSLQLLAGFGPYDRIYLGNQFAELPTRSAVFTRSSTATYIDKSGVLQTAAINEPRFEKDGLLMEGQSTNLAIYSSPTQDYSSYFRSGANNTRTFKPEGGVLLTTLTDTGTWWEQNINVANYDPTKPASVSCYLEFPAAAKVRVMLMRYSSEGDIAAAFITAAPGVNKVSVPVLGGTVNQRLGLRITVDAGTPVSSVIFIDRMQIEGSAQATSYIPTSGAAATRTVDILNLQTQGNVGYDKIGDTFSRTIALEFTVDSFQAPATGNAYVDYLLAVGSSNDIMIRSTGTQLLCYRGSQGPGLAVTYPFSKKIYAQTIDVADNNTVAMYFDGAMNARPAGTPPNPAASPSNIRFGGNAMAVFHIRNFRIWHRVLTSNQIKGLK